MNQNQKRITRHADMNRTTKNIITVAVAAFSAFVYFYGVWSWQVLQDSDKKELVAKGKYVYFVCFSSAFYLASLIGFVLSETWIQKAATSTLNTLCAVIIYEECSHGDKQWTLWSYLLIPVIAANYMLMYNVIDKLKKR